MSTLKLFNIYHSFLIKKWYLLVYILLLLIALLGLMIGIQHVNQKDDNFTIGIVDKDQSKETKLILNAVGDGQSLGDNLNIEQYNEQEAEKLLKSKKIDGYFLFNKGMTKAFYKNGELPIVVNTYDTQSIESIVIMQLTDSVYSRLMLSMGGALTYTHLYEDASDEELLNMMTDMLFTGLNRNGSFEEEPVKVYDTLSYYIVAFYFVSIFFFFFSIFSILKMNQKNALKERLSMFHFSYEKLTIVRGLFSLIYTTIWSCFGLWLILKFLKPNFEMYNWPTLLIYIVYYLFMLTAIFIFIDVTARQAFNYVWKIILTGAILIFSGATIPVVYLKGLFNNIIDMSPFTIVMNQLLELILNNYILNIHPMFYWNILIVICLLVISLVWRYRQ